MTDHPSHPQILDGMDMAPDMCAVCRFEGLDLEAACGNKADRDARRKKRDASLRANMDAAVISCADHGLRSLEHRPDLHAQFKRILVDRFERQTGKLWHEVKTPKDTANEQ